MELKNRKRKVLPGDTIILYRDPKTEQEPEGWAKVWEVLEEQEELVLLYVSFMGDPLERRVHRSYRLYDTVEASGSRDLGKEEYENN